MPQSNEETIGLIGLGLLGGAIARRLLERGLPLLGSDVDRDARDRLAEMGSEAASDGSELFQRCDVVLLCLPDSKVVQQVLDEAERLDDWRTRLVIDATTGGAEGARAAADRLHHRGVGYVESSVAGSSRQMQQGEVALLLGGAAEQIEAATPWLEPLSSKRFHVGPVGAAADLKLVHNLLLGLHRAALAEALVFAERLGFDRATTLAVLRQTPAYSAAMPTKGDKMARRDYQTQAKLAQHAKDVRLILQRAADAGAAVPLSEVHDTLLQRGIAAGLGELDNAAIIEVLDQLAGEQ